jgi:hypothetical protein
MAGRNGRDVQGVGGAIYCFNNILTMENCTFTNNVAQALGQGSSEDQGTTFAARPESLGGAIHLRFGDATITGCVIRNSQAETSQNGEYAFALGGGLYGDTAKITMTNTIVADNEISDGRDGVGGAGLYIDNKNLPATKQILSNCTIARNLSDSSNSGHAGGIIFVNASPVLANCILWDNTSQEIGLTNSTPVISYSNVQGGAEGVGNLNVEPVFVLPGSGNYRLGAGSPMIDAGRDTSGATYGNVLIDFEDDARGLDGSAASVGDGSDYDIGADEFVP